MTDASDQLDAFELMRRLHAAGIHFRLNSIRDDALLFEVAVPGERWEIELLADGEIEIERFKSDGRILGAEALAGLIEKYSEPAQSETGGDSRSIN